MGILVLPPPLPSAPLIAGRRVAALLEPARGARADASPYPRDRRAGY